MFSGQMCSSDVGIIPLYENTPVTVLQALHQHFMWFTHHPSVSKDAFLDMLYTLHHHTLPHGNLLPDSYDKAVADKRLHHQTRCVSLLS